MNARTRDLFKTDPEVSEEVDRLMTRVREHRSDEAICQSLRAASLLIENAAFEMARHDNAKEVSRLILTAAELDRMVTEMEHEE